MNWLARARRKGHDNQRKKIANEDDICSQKNRKVRQQKDKELSRNVLKKEDKQFLPLMKGQAVTLHILIYMSINLQAQNELKEDFFSFVYS